MGKILISHGLSFLTHKMGPQATILYISQDCHEDQMNSQVREMYGGKQLTCQTQAGSTQLPTLKHL